MSGEPVRYSTEEQFLAFRDADYVVIAAADRLSVTKPVQSAKTRDVLGPVRDVTAMLTIHQKLRGEGDAHQAEWHYQLQFGVEPSLREGELALFFLNRGVGDGDPVVVHAAYLNEDSAVPLPETSERALRGAQAVAARFSELDADGGKLGTFWIGSQPTPELEALAAGLSYPAATNHVSIFVRRSEGWQLLESVEVPRRWPY